MRHDVKLTGRMPDGTECEGRISVYTETDDDKEFDAKVMESLPIVAWFQNKENWPDVPAGVPVTLVNAEEIEDRRPKVRVHRMPSGLAEIFGNLLPPGQ